MPIGDAPFDTTEKATDGAESETAETTGKDEISTEAEEIADAIEPGEKAAEAESTDQDEVDRILKEANAEESTPNVQKRIDKLTAQVKALEAENQKLQTGDKKVVEKEYTQEQLAHAMMKAVQDDNPDLMRDVIDEIQKGVEKKLVKMYTEEKTVTEKQSQAIENEWKEVTDAYSKYSDTKIAPIWPTSHKDLDIKSATSLLYQVAMALYHNQDPEKAAYYKQPGGQKLAVADALTHLLRTKAGKLNDPKVKKLEKQLTKERMKKSPVSGGPGAEGKGPAKPKTVADTLKEVIDERKKFQDERT
jgi:hypothetical protein